MKRSPIVAGQFYYGTDDGLNRQVAGYVDENRERQEVIGIISPHAGLMYSGAVAGSLYSKIIFPETFILIGPNHSGLGKSISLMRSGSWEIPIGTLEIDEEVAAMILNTSEIVFEDAKAHYYEHSLEVQLPFIYYFSPKAKIVPITMMSTSLENCQALGQTLADVIQSVDRQIVIVASSDMNHYETDEVTREKDAIAIEKALSLDPEGLYHAVRRYGISMCGYGPATTMLYAAKALGATSAELVDYMTSGEINGDYSRVVGYAGIAVKK
jgi:hypothetical protein